MHIVYLCVFVIRMSGMDKAAVYNGNCVCIHFLLDCRLIVYVLLIVLSLFLKPLKDKIASTCGYRGWGQTSIQ